MLATAASFTIIGSTSGLVSAADPIECSLDGTTPVRLYNGGTKVTDGGIEVPAGATITSIVVETYDDYDEAGSAPGDDRVVANQKEEQVVILVGGTQVGDPTQDVPEPGPTNRKASITSTVFTGNSSANGRVTVKHVGGPTTPNSVQIKKITVTFVTATTDCGGYPVGGEEQTVVKEVVVVTPNTPTGVITPVAAAPATETPVIVYAPVVDNPTAAAAAQVPAAVLPAVLAATPAAAAPVVAGNGLLPATGSDSINLLQVGAAAAAAGAGMILVASRRRKAASVRTA